MMRITKFNSKLKLKKEYFVLIFIIIFNLSFSQTLTDKLGGIETNFTISNALIDIPVMAQSIIKRGYYNAYYSTDYGTYTDGAYGHGYGYGLETYHLEFISSFVFNEIDREEKGIE